MFRNLFKSPIKAWAIKQIDDATLHLCGQGTPQSDQKPRKIREALHAGQFQGGVRMGDSGIVVNTRLLAAVVPLEALKLLDNGNAADWKMRRWAVSHVPQHSWLFAGPLVAEPNPTGGPPALISREDVSHIRRQARQDAGSTGNVVFRPVNQLEDPEKDLRDAMEEARRRRHDGRRGWRKDGTWGLLEEASEE